MSKFIDDDKGPQEGGSTPRPVNIFQRLAMKPGRNMPNAAKQGGGGSKGLRSSRSIEDELTGGRRRSADSASGQDKPQSSSWVGKSSMASTIGAAVPGHLKMKARGAPDGDPVPSWPRAMGQTTPSGNAVSRFLQSRTSSDMSTGSAGSTRSIGKVGREMNFDLTSAGAGEPRGDSDVESSTDDDEEDEGMGPPTAMQQLTGGQGMMLGETSRPPLAQTKTYSERKLDELLAEDVVNLQRLREQSWGGIPRRYRATIWRLLLGYLPANRDRREATLGRKRREYSDLLPMYFNIPPEERTIQEQEILRQILVDLPRTQPDMPLFHQDPIQRCMERILYVWAIRHPASGYVQGMNDLITPLILIFIGEHLDNKLEGLPVEALDVSRLPEEALQQVEADVYWCITKLLDNIQDHYTFSQPGLQRMIFRLAELVERHDRALHHHLEAEGIQYVQFSFRWMNCLLMRELSLDAIIRCWDTELSEDNGFEVFHVYLCAAFLLRFSEHLRTLQFQELVLFLQDPPTRGWSLSEDVEPLLSQAHVLRSLYPDIVSSRH